MWTYLAIFSSLAVLIGVFFRRIILLKKGGAVVAESAEEASAEKTAEAVKRPKKIAASIVEEVEGLCAKGEGFLSHGKDDEAIKCFVRALALDEFHHETQHKLAMLYLQKQMYSAAAALFRQLAEVTADPVHYSHLGLALYQQSSYEESLAAYQKAVDLDGSRPQRFISLAQVYRALGKLNHAAIALGKAMEVDQENLDIIFLLAEIQVELGEVDEAKLLLAKLLSLEPGHVEARALMGELSGVEGGL